MTARPLPSHIAPVVLVAAALLAAGCTTSRTSSNSASKFRGDQKLAAQTIEDLQSAASFRDATARVRFETGKTDRTATIQLQREAGRWRVAGF
jgi:outer membrane biogenesis lipoprotein LolB